MNARISTAIACMFALAASAGAATIEIDREALVRGRATPVRVVPDTVAPGADSGWTVIVEYFPNSKVVRDDTLGVTVPGRPLTWTPRFAGIASVIAIRGDERASTPVSVKFPAVPAGAIIVFLFASTVLFGGAGWSLIRLAEREPPDEGGAPLP